MDSDTESEGEHAMPSAATSKAEFVLRQPRASSDLSVAEAIAILVATAPRATSLGSDAGLHENVVAASSSLNSFLDTMLRVDPTQKQDICALFDAFLSFLNAEFLSALFTHRRAVYSLLRSLGDTSSVSVPWTDILLLKLCRVVANMSSGYTQASAQAQLLDAQALWAVRQLPQNVQDLTPSIYSAYASPGMRKLALQLVFGACIVRPSMAGDTEPQCVPVNSDDIEGIARFYGDLTVRRAGGLGDDEKLSCAMVAVLCATFALKQADNSPSPASRPYFSSLVFGCLHELFDTSRLDLFSNDPLGPAQLLLLSWGDVLPWCWRACTDPRSADMTLVSLLTALWLRHQSREDTDELGKSATLNLLMPNLSLSVTHILQLLYRVDEALNNEWTDGEAVACLARLVCWSMTQLSDPLLEGHIVFFPDAVLHLCNIFLHYVGGGTAGLDVAESALQALLHVESSDVCVAAERLAEGHDFPSAFDRGHFPSAAQIFVPPSCCLPS
ncbi:hypothetical protein PENSPDRAFT_72197 [Peniophora sp. CONT]|nr:hypothetical protein PENSPDRAFT_72197 [Peniophora sp. CONT]